MYTQVILPGNKTHFDHLAEHVLCIDEFKLGVLAQNCVAPGFTALVYLLITSLPGETKREAMNFFDKKGYGHWIPEYMEGASMELYSVIPMTVTRFTIRVDSYSGLVHWNAVC